MSTDNLAKRGTAKQSSSYGSYNASKALDGDKIRTGIGTVVVILDQVERRHGGDLILDNEPISIIL
jgi:hypothetical protein